jgi:hypothetical protein
MLDLDEGVVASTHKLYTAWSTLKGHVSMKQFALFITLFLGFMWVGKAMAVEEPKHEVLFTDGYFEIRKYAPTLMAETFVEGDMDEASSKGFRVLADYIFGNNQLVSSSVSSSTSSSASGKIAMTAPVTLQPQTETISMHAAKRWIVNFTMPSQYTLASIPKPKNAAVTLREIPSKYFAVYKYSGFNTVDRVQSKTVEAMEWTRKKNLKIMGTPQLSRYDPPWTLPMFRRNEIMIEIADPSK